MAAGDWNWTGAAAGGAAGTAVAPGIGTGIGFVGGGLAGGLIADGFDPLGSFFGGGNSYTMPKKADFAYGGTGEAQLQGRGERLYGENRYEGMQDLGRFRDTRNQMTGQIGELRRLAVDPRASQAWWQMQAGQDANARQALMLARSGGGGAQQAAALRAASLQNATAGQQLNNQMGALRAQEQAAANQQIGQLMTAGAGLDSQTALAQFQMGQQGLASMYGLGQNAAALQQKGMTDYWKTRLGAEAAANQAASQQQAGMMGAAGTIGAAALLSDIRGKSDVYPVGSYVSDIRGKTDIAPVGSGLNAYRASAGLNNQYPQPSVTNPVRPAPMSADAWYAQRGPAPAHQSMQQGERVWDPNANMGRGRYTGQYGAPTLDVIPQNYAGAGSYGETARMLASYQPPPGQPSLSDIRGKADIVPIGTQIGSMNPIAPMYDTGARIGAMPQMGADYSGQDAAQPMAVNPAEARANLAQAQSIGGALSGIFAPGRMPGELAMPDQYLGTLSDARAKKLESENTFLKQLLSPQATASSYLGEQVGDAIKQHLPPKPQQLQRLPDAGYTLVRDKQPANELEAERMGKAWFEARKAEAAQDYLKQQDYMKQVRQAQAERDLAEQSMRLGVMTGNPYNPTPPPQPVVSDERSKQEIAKLNGIIQGLTGGRYLDADAPAENSFDEQAFRRWYGGHAKKNRLDPNPDSPEHMYDYRAAYRAGSGPDASGHWPSEFKSDDHPRRFLYLDGVRTDTRTGLPSQEGVPTARFPDVKDSGMVRPELRQPNTSALDDAYLKQRALQSEAAAIPAYKFRYKEPFASQYGPEPRVGVMAQDLERNPATASTVRTGPDGLKRVDADQLTMTNTAFLGELARIQQEQEAKIDALTKGRGKAAYPKGKQPESTQPAFDIDDKAMWWGPGF